MIRYERLPGETDDQLLFRIAKEKDVTGLTWQEIADEMNRLTSQNYTESKYRKTWNSYTNIFNANQGKIVGEQYIEDAEELRREIERQKIQYRDERIAWNKQNYIAARAEQKLDYMEAMLSDIGRVQFPPIPHVIEKSNNDLLVLFSDLHIGQCFYNCFGRFDSDIAKERLGKYLHEVLSIAKMHRSENCYVVILGDCISGSIHKTIQVTNRENTIEQIKLASEMIASFVAELSAHFCKVMVTGVSGNHTRIDKKDEAIHDERLDDLILWITGLLLQQMDNVIVEMPNIDIGIAKFDIRGHEFTAVHGDYDNINPASLGKLSMMLKYIPEYLILGHLHYCEMTECNGVHILRGGSLPGAGDQHTVELRLTGNPQQMCCVVDATGVTAAYPINLL